MWSGKSPESSEISGRESAAALQTYIEKYEIENPSILNSISTCHIPISLCVLRSSVFQRFWVRFLRSTKYAVLRISI